NAANASFSAHVRLLANLEQGALYNAANFSVGCFNDGGGSQINATVISPRVSAFLCPSCPPPTWTLSKVGGLPIIAPATNYYACSGSGLEFDFTNTVGPPNGAFGYAAPGIGIRDVTDGTSNTVAFGEWKVGDGLLNQFALTDIILTGTTPPGVTRNT